MDWVAIFRYDHTMRAFTIFILCLMAAFQGNVSAMELKEPCPMEQGMHGGVMDDFGGASDCCNDAETAAKTGKLCKTGQECSLSQLFPLISRQLPNQIPLATTPRVAGKLSSPSFNLPDIWRPPTLS